MGQLSAKNKVKMDKKILLHACCAICAGYPIEKLLEEGYSPVVFFSNDNIDTEDEFETRKNALIKLCEHFNVKYIIDDYSPNLYLDKIKGLEDEPERGNRCDSCIYLRLEKSSQKAKELGIKEFTTTLVISPHKDYDKITAIGKTFENTSLKYIGINFKKQDGFLKTNRISKELNLYRQNYCGCKFAKSHLKKGLQNGM